MKLFKKFIAVLLAVMLIIGGAAVSTSAADVKAPVFNFTVKSKTSSTVTLELALVSGSVSSMDVRFETSSKLGECKSIKITTEFANLKNDYMDDYHSITNASYTVTSMFSMAASKPVEVPVSILNVTFERRGGEISDSDYNLVFESCIVISGSKNVDVSSYVSVIKSAGYIVFDSVEISGNYKDTQKISYTTTYGEDEIEWSTSNAKVATVDKSGKVTMTGKGTAIITAKSVDGAVEASCKVTVNYSAWQWVIIIVLFGWIWYI